MELAFKNVIQLLDHFKEEAVCVEFLEAQLWAGTPVCPHCGSLKKPYKTTRGYKCSDSACYKKFTVTTGTYFHSSKLSLRIWFGAIYLCTAHKKGISSHQLGRDLGVTQKTAWFLLHRIREMMCDEEPLLLTGTVEVDEMYIGGKFKNKSVTVRKAMKSTSMSHTHKTAVMGMVERGGRVVAKVVPDVMRSTVIPVVVANVSPEAVVYTDTSQIYNPLHSTHSHERVNHTNDEYVRGDVHTNTIEGFWSQMKRGIYGIYHQVSPKHLGAYCNEFSYRYNTRDITDQKRFFNTLTLAHGRLRYEDLIKE